MSQATSDAVHERPLVAVLNIEPAGATAIVRRTEPFVEAMSEADEIPGYFGPHPLRIRYGPNEDDAEYLLMLAEDQAHELTHMTEASEPEHEWALIPTEAEKKWKRFLIAQIGLARLRGFWAQLGQYLKYVKWRTRPEALL